MFPTEQQEQTPSVETPADTAPQRKEKESEPYTLRTFFNDLMDIAEAALITTFTFMLAFTFLFRPVTVEGSSMRDTLYDGDQLLIFDRIGDYFRPTNGNIVVIDDREAGHFVDHEQTQVENDHGLEIVIVKRLIATGGQEVNIDFEHGNVAVDGRQLQEPYVKELTYRNDGAFYYPFVVPEGYLFVMGDNRNGSTDSRNPSVALVPQDQVLGTVVMRYRREPTFLETNNKVQQWLEGFDWLLW